MNRIAEGEDRRHEPSEKRSRAPQDHAVPQKGENAPAGSECGTGHENGGEQSADDKRDSVEKKHRRCPDQTAECGGQYRVWTGQFFGRQFSGEDKREYVHTEVDEKQNVRVDGDSDPPLLLIIYHICGVILSYAGGGAYFPGSAGNAPGKAKIKKSKIFEKSFKKGLTN